MWFLEEYASKGYTIDVDMSDQRPFFKEETE
jgi:hypothetical protein